MPERARRVGQRLGRLPQLLRRQLELADHDQPAPALQRQPRIVGLALDRARQDLERVADAAERHLRPRQRQHRIDVGGVATVASRAAATAASRLPRSSFDSGGAKSGFSSSDIVSGC